VKYVTASMDTITVRSRR